MESIYQAFLVSIVRSLLLVAGGWLVSRGLAEADLMREVAAGLAIIIVTQAWAFVRIHRQVLYQKWLLTIGLDSPADTDPSTVREAARSATRRGLPL